MIYTAFEFFINKFIILRKKKDSLFLPILNFLPIWVKPNAVSLARLLLILPLVIIVDPRSSVNSFSALAGKRIIIISLIYIFGFASDLLDGALARIRRNETTIGIYFDSIIDKLFILPLSLFFYLEFPVLHRSLLFFFIFKLFLILVLLIQAYHHYDKRKLDIIRNYYGQIYTAGYIFFFYFLIRDLN